MRPRAPAVRVGPLVIDWRLTTQPLDAFHADRSARERADGDGVAIPESSAPPPSTDRADEMLDELDERSAGAAPWQSTL